MVGTLFGNVQVPADWQIVFLGGEDLMQQQGRQ